MAVELVLRALGSLSLQALRPGSPMLPITIPRGSGDVGQPYKPAVIQKCFANVPLSFNVTYPAYVALELKGISGKFALSAFDLCCPYLGLCVVKKKIAIDLRL